jgi:hypothetical protein
MNTFPGVLADLPDFASLPWQETTVWAVAGLSFLIIMLFAFGLLPRQKTPGRHQNSH